MKKIKNKILILYCLTICMTPHFSDKSEVDSIEYFIVEWEAKRLIAMTPKTIKEKPSYYFKDNIPDFFLMFDDKEDCIKKLKNDNSPINQRINEND